MNGGVAMPVAVYLRVSTEEQRERQSIATQREFAERYCALHDLSVFRTYADDGISGTVPLDQRPEGSHVLREARLGKFDQLLVYRLDRLGRETRLILIAVDQLEKCGVRVRSMTEEFDTATATGRLMLTMLSGFATHEHSVIRERSLAGASRVARAGGWLGGIVPFGYRKLGEKGQARLVISEESISDLDLSEADVVRMIYTMSAVDRKSCHVIATRLNELQIPCAYQRDDRLVVRGKRKQRTSGLWRPGRVRNLIISETYKGTHRYGKRTHTKGRETILRMVPAIVSEGVWDKAQATLRANVLFSARSAKNKYLLRGLIRCSLCGKTFIGLVSNRPNGKREFYYRCNLAHSPSLYAATGRCPAKAVRGDFLEAQVWSDIATFLRDPGPVLEQLRARLESDVKGSDQTRKQLARLEGLLAQKATERTRVVSLYRRGRLTDAELDVQMEEIGKEQLALEAQISELGGRIAGADSIAGNIDSAQALLAKLRKRLDSPISWELKRRLVEILVAGIRVDTTEVCGVKQTETTVTYRFAQPGEAMPLLLPKSYSTGSVIRIPMEPKTVGDHIRRRRLAQKMLQREVAEQLGVDDASVYNWEANTFNPCTRHMPAIIVFLGYNPLPPANTLAEHLVRQRTSLGLSRRRAAERLGVDVSTLARWELGEREPTGAALARVNSFLKDAEVSRARRAG